MSLFSLYHVSKRKCFLTAICLSGILLIFIFFLYPYMRGEDGRFEDYTNVLFRQEVSSNAITLHYTLMDPSRFRIHETPISLGQVSTDVAAIGASAENALSALHTFDCEELSEENQLIYKLLEESFLLSRDMAPYALYEEPLSPLTGTQAQLPVLLSEYPFYSLDDVHVYLKLLKTLPSYYQAILDFEQAKAEAGLFMSDERVIAVIEECEAFVGMGDSHYLYDTFEKRLSALGDDSSKTAALMAEHERCIEEYVFPAYELLASGLRKLSGNCKNKQGLCHFPDGKSYYELLVRNVTGSDRTILELQTMTYKQIIADIEDMQEVLAKMEASLDTETFEASYGDGSSFDSDFGEVFADSNPSAILSSLHGKLKGNFPKPPAVDITVKYVADSMEDYLSPAFYLIPAIDNSKENVIYINPKHMGDDLELFTTLAHEGYPGHLYQTTYFQNTNPAPIRSLLGCGGYTEGWATYCEMMSYYLAPISKEEATLAQKNASVMLALYALADMGIHYKGWSLADTVDFFADYGIEDEGAVSEIYEMILGDPANYLKYYIGYLEFLELKKDAIGAWGDEFSQERFHREVLEAGPVPFAVLRERML